MLLRGQVLWISVIRAPMTVSRLRRGLDKMAKTDDMETVLRELAKEAMITGGSVWTFGPDGSEQLYPPASCSRSRARR